MTYYIIYAHPAGLRLFCLTPNTAAAMFRENSTKYRDPYSYADFLSKGVLLCPTQFTTKNGHYFALEGFYLKLFKMQSSDHLTPLVPILSPHVFLSLHVRPHVKSPNELYVYDPIENAIVRAGYSSELKLFCVQPEPDIYVNNPDDIRRLKNLGRRLRHCVISNVSYVFPV